MGNGKFLQFLTLLLCLCFGYFTYKAYSDVQQVKEENAILHEALDSLLVGSTMTSPDAEPDPLSAASTITDEEVIEACKKAALRTDFSSNYDVTIQRGTITYTFYR